MRPSPRTSVRHSWSGRPGLPQALWPSLEPGQSRQHHLTSKGPSGTTAAQRLDERRIIPHAMQKLRLQAQLVPRGSPAPDTQREGQGGERHLRGGGEQCYPGLCRGNPSREHEATEGNLGRGATTPSFRPAKRPCPPAAPQAQGGGPRAAPQGQAGEAALHPTPRSKTRGSLLLWGPSARGPERGHAACSGAVLGSARPAGPAATAAPEGQEWPRPTAWCWLQVLQSPLRWPGQCVSRPGAPTRR